VSNLVDNMTNWVSCVGVCTCEECANVDGSGYYDGETNTWHYIGQCLDRTEVWNMCHFTREGLSPMGPFTPDPHNPVVCSGQLWRLPVASPLSCSVAIFSLVCLM
jgi:hypothetical protein